MALKIEKKVKLLLRKGKKVFNIFSSFYTFVAFVGAVGLLPFALVLYLGKFNRVRFLVIVKLLKDIIEPLLSMMYGLCSQTHLTVANYSRHNLSFFFFNFFYFHFSDHNLSLLLARQSPSQVPRVGFRHNRYSKDRHGHHQEPGHCDSHAASEGSSSL